VIWKGSPDYAKLSPRLKHGDPRRSTEETYVRNFVALFDVYVRNFVASFDVDDHEALRGTPWISVFQS
jgi:hypothetical protein